MLMSDDWFSANVFQVVAPRQKIPADLVKVFDESTAVVLPPWDPLGSVRRSHSVEMRSRLILSSREI